MKEINRCPFCGDTASLSDIDYGDHFDGWRVVCDDDSEGGCGAKGPIRVDREAAMAAWNKRVG